MWLKIVLLSLLGCDLTVSSSFEIRGVVAGNRMAGVPLGKTLGEGELDVEGICTEAGMTCQNCTHAVTCIPLPVGWLKVPLQECPDGQTCNAHLKQCTTQAVPECDVVARKYIHRCEQVGIFPDPFDCRKFHLCSPPENFPDGRPADHRQALCPRHYGYNPQTAQCSIPLEHGQCSKNPIPTCTFIGQSGPLELSLNHYYFCLSKQGALYPQIFVCPHGWFYWDNFCHPEPQKHGDASQDSSHRESTSSSTTTAAAITTTVSSKPAISKIDLFFSTEKAITYAPDTFLADKFDLVNYETIDDDVPNTNDDLFDSLEIQTDF